VAILAAVRASAPVPPGWKDSCDGWLRLLRKKNVLQLGLLSLLDLAAFFSPALRFKRLVFAHTHLLHKESLPTDFACHFPPPS
jgi:hypothetical protein